MVLLFYIFFSLFFGSDGWQSDWSLHFNLGRCVFIWIYHSAIFNSYLRNFFFTLHTDLSLLGLVLNCHLLLIFAFLFISLIVNFRVFSWWFRDWFVFDDFRLTCNLLLLFTLEGTISRKGVGLRFGFNWLFGLLLFLCPALFSFFTNIEHILRCLYLQFMNLLIARRKFLRYWSSYVASPLSLIFLVRNIWALDLDLIFCWFCWSHLKILFTSLYFTQLTGFPSNCDQIFFFRRTLNARPVFFYFRRWNLLGGVHKVLPFFVMGEGPKRLSGRPWSWRTGFTVFSAAVFRSQSSIVASLSG